MKLFKRSISAILVIAFLSTSVLSQLAYASCISSNGNVLEQQKLGSMERLQVKRKLHLKQDKNKPTDQLIVKFKDESRAESVTQSVYRGLHLKKLSRVNKVNSTGLSVYKIDEPGRLDEIIDEFDKSEEVLYVQPNYRYQSVSVTSEVYDPEFDSQWGLYNVGQAVCGQTGTPGMDIKAIDAWNITRGNGSVLVGVLDTGIDTGHEDLRDSIYINPGEIPGNGIDDDHNLAVDDISGYDFYNYDTSVCDSVYDDGHGTHVAGIIAAGANDKGIMGVAPEVKIVPLKFMQGGEGYTLDAVIAIEYAKASGIKIINCSWGSLNYDEALYDEMLTSRITFICSAGNGGGDTGQAPFYPACFGLPNIVSVAAADSRGQPAVFTNYGSGISVAAPEVNILSTIPGDNYGYMSGTSMAAAFVTGTAALIKSYEPDITANELAERLRTTVSSVAALSGAVSSGGMVNAYNALTDNVTQPLPPVTGSSSLKITIGVAEGSTGDMVSVPIEFSDVPQAGILCGSMNLRYDKTALLFSGITGGSILGNPVDDISVNAGSEIPDGMRILYSDVMAGDAPITGSGLFATLTFQIAPDSAAGTYEITVDVNNEDYWYDTNYNVIGVAYIIGREGTAVIQNARVEQQSSTLRVGGSTTMFPMAGAFESGFESANPYVNVIVSEGSSDIGLNGVLDNTLDVGMMSRDLTAAEKVNYPFVIPITIGKDAIAVIVNPSNPILNLSADQVMRIFSSAYSSSPQRITNWASVGGRNALIAVHTMEDGSGTLDSFKSMALNNTSIISGAVAHTSARAMVDAVAANVNAIGFVSRGCVTPSVFTLTINGTSCNVENAENGTYPYVRPLNYITKREAVGAALKWIYYSLSPAGQNIMEAKGYIRIMKHQRMTVAVDAGNPNLRYFAQEAANELSAYINMPVDITAFTNEDSALAQVENGSVEGALIYGTLPPSWAGSGLSARAVTQDATQTKFYIATKCFESVDALGGIEVYRQILRNPTGQKMALENNLYRIWLFGDVTGDEMVNSADYASLRSYLLKRVTTLGAQNWLFSADVTGDGLINAADYSVLQAHLLRKPIAYPVFPANNYYKDYYSQGMGYNEQEVFDTETRIIEPIQESGNHDIKFTDSNQTFWYVEENPTDYAMKQALISHGYPGDIEQITNSGNLYYTYHSYLKSHNIALNLKPEQYAFLYLYNKRGTQLMFHDKILYNYSGAKESVRQAFRILYDREPRYYSLINGQWNETSSWDSSAYSEAEVAIGGIDVLPSLVQLVTAGLIAATIYVGVGEIAIFAEGVSLFGLRNTLTMWSYGTLPSTIAFQSGLNGLTNSAQMADVLMELDAGTWGKGWLERGNIIDRIRGNNLGYNFPVIDKLEGQTAVSIKSLDTAATTYQKGSTLLSKLKSFANQLNNFHGTRYNNVSVYEGTQFTAKSLELVIPDVELSTAQMQAIIDAKAYAQSLGLGFRIVVGR